MPAGPRQIALRKYQQAVADLICKYGVSPLDKDPKLSDVAQCHRRLLKKVHPDKGGDADDFRALQSAKEALDRAMRAPEDARPPTPSAPPQAPSRKRPCSATPVASPSMSIAGRSLVALSEDLCPFCAETSNRPAKMFRIQSNGVLLTYNGEHYLKPNVFIFRH